MTGWHRSLEFPSSDMTGRAAGDVRAAIDAAGGAIAFSTYVELALYGPHGFYTDPPAAGSAGRRGDFITAPEVGRDGELAEVLSARFDPVPVVLADRPAHGARAPLYDAALSWLAGARRLVERGSVVVIDYARPSTAELVALPWRSWLRTYRGH